MCTAHPCSMWVHAAWWCLTHMFALYSCIPDVFPWIMIPQSCILPRINMNADMSHIIYILPQLMPCSIRWHTYFTNLITLAHYVPSTYIHCSSLMTTDHEHWWFCFDELILFWWLLSITLMIPFSWATVHSVLMSYYPIALMSTVLRTWIELMS